MTPPLGRARDRLRRRGLVPGVLLVSAVVTACVDAPADPSGADRPEPVSELVLVVPGAEGSPEADIATIFVDAVAEADARIAVAVELTGSVDLAGEGTPATSVEADAIDRLTGGRADLGLIPTRAWADTGVASLVPFQLPGTVETDRQADRVARSAAVVAALDGLADSGVTGLVLFPLGARRLWTFTDDPVVSLDDLEGRRVFSAPSSTASAVLIALGAEPQFASGPAMIRDALAGSVAGMWQGAESMLRAVGTTGPTSPRSVVADLALYTRFDVLAVNDEILASLDDEQRNALRTAAMAALDRALIERERELETLETACAAGIDVHRAGPDLAAALTAAGQAIEARLPAEISTLVTDLRQAAGTDHVALPGCAADR